MYSTSRVVSSSSANAPSCITSGEMVSSFLPADMAARCSSLQITVHEVGLLQPAQALANVLCPDLADALYRLQLSVRGGQQLVQTAELGDDVADHELRQPRYAA